MIKCIHITFHLCFNIMFKNNSCDHIYGASWNRTYFFRVSSLAYPNLLGKKDYVVVVVVVRFD